MSQEGGEDPPAANPGHFTGNIMNFERPKFNARQENRLEALKAFKKKCGYIFKGSLVNISDERKCVLVQDWLGPEGQKIYDSLDWEEGEDVNNYELMWTKLEGAVSPECNEIVASKKFKERVQKPGETITAFITDLMLLVKDCNYVDEDRQVRDQFVYGICDEELKKKLLEKGNTLTRIEATSIGKAHETTKQEVQECSTKHPVKESVHTVSKDNDKSKKGLMCNFCANKKGAHSFSNKRLCPAWGAVCKLCKIKNHFKDSKECKRLQKERQVKPADQKQTRSPKKPFVLKVEEDGEEHYYEVVDKICVLNQTCDHKKAFANLLLSKKRIPVHFQIDTGSTCSILPVSLYKDISGDHQLNDINTSVRPVLSLYDEKTKISTLGTRKVFVLNPATKEEIIIQFRIVDEDFTPLIGLNDSEALKLIAVLQDNIALVEAAKPSVPSTASEVLTPLTMETILSNYSQVFDDTIGKFEGELHLYTKQECPPHKTAPREIPLSVKNNFIAEIKDLQEQGILEKVTEPTDWVSAPTMVNKPSAKNGIRLCIDSRPLNTALKRTEYPIPTVDNLLTEIGNAKVFTLADIKSAFWHVPLDEASSLLTTFNTPLGRMKWNRMPFGINVAPEEFQRRIDENLEGLEGVKAIADDILIWGDGDTTEKATANHDKRLLALLERCQQKNIKLNKEKFQLRKTELSYMGVVLTAHGVKPDPKKQDCIQSMPAPTNKDEVRRLLGMITYLSRFSENLSTTSDPLRTLLRKDTAFIWEANEQRAFDQLKELISNAPLLKYFNPTERVEVQVDASSTGLGACLMQGGQPIHYASRALTDTERRYSQIEKEMLSIVYGLTRFHTYTYGRKVTVYNDHKPLAAVLKKPVADNPVRLQRMLCRIMGYDLEFKYVKGKDLLIADTLSRLQTTNQNRSKSEQEIEITRLVIEDQSLTSHLSEIAVETGKDTVLQSVIRHISEGWTTRKGHLPAALLPFWTIKDELSFGDGVVYRGDRIVVPTTLRKTLTAKLHQAHMGTESTLRRARTSLWWPGMNSQLKQFIASCDVCNSFQRNNQKEPLMSHHIPNRPWSKVGCDIFEWNKEHYLVFVDYYSDWIEFDHMRNQTAAETIDLMHKQFARWGLPDEIVTDCGKNYDSAEFSHFCQRKKIKHTKSSPHHHQSNGKVESAVKIVKTLLRKSAKSALNPYEALLDQRNTPTVGMTTSPTQRFLNRRTKTEIPMKATLLTPELAEKVLEEKAKKTKKSQAYYDRTAKDFTELKPGDTVRIRPDGLVKGQEWRKGSVVQIHGYRSYDVKVDGKVLNRNRVHLKPEQKVSAPTMPSDARKPNKQTIVPVQKSGVNPREAKQTVKPAEPAVNMELITAKRTRSGRLVKVPARYLP